MSRPGDIVSRKIHHHFIDEFRLVDRAGVTLTLADLVITDIKMPDLDGIDAAAAIYQNEPVPFILLSAYHRPQLFERAKADHILAYLVKPTKQADLEAAIAIAMQRFEQFRALREEAADQRQAMEDRKVIERAKGLLMKSLGLDEEAAFRRLRKLARDGNRKLIDVARMILSAGGSSPPSDHANVRSPTDHPPAGNRR